MTQLPDPLQLDPKPPPAAEPVEIADAEVVEDVLEGAVEKPTEQTAERTVEETVDGMPVLVDVRPIERAPSVALPAVQAAAVAATGFVAGAATVALVRRHSARKLARSRRRPVDLLPVVGTRTFLVDVHLIAKPGE
jgi:hypothetical protein